MGVPDVKAAVGVLRGEAKTWDDQVPHLNDIVTKADDLRMTRLEAGIFQVLVSAYSELVEVVVSRCEEGRTRMGEVALALRQIANTYEAEDLAGEHKIRNLY